MAGTRTEMVPSNENSTPGYLSRPESEGTVPGVIVIQEWWGLNDNIKHIADRFASEGFAAFAPDLYHGKITDEPDEAQKLMMQTDMNRASRELVRATEFLAEQPFIGDRGVGAIGFCMGGGLALTLACDTPLIRAVAPFYGANPQPIEKVRNLQGPVFAVFAEHDDWSSQTVREALQAALEEHGKSYEIETYPGTEHAFFNDTRPEVFEPEAAADAWSRVLSLFRENL